jgi:hypothetical protein
MSWGSQSYTTFKKSAELDLTLWTCLLIFEIFDTGFNQIRIFQYHFQ